MIGINILGKTCLVHDLSVKRINLPWDGGAQTMLVEGSTSFFSRFATRVYRDYNRIEEIVIDKIITRWKKILTALIDTYHIILVKNYFLITPFWTPTLYHFLEHHNYHPTLRLECSYKLIFRYWNDCISLQHWFHLFLQYSTWTTHFCHRKYPIQSLWSPCDTSRKISDKIIWPDCHASCNARFRLKYFLQFIGTILHFCVDYALKLCCD